MTQTLAVGHLSNKVEVFTDVYSYDIFSLIVDLGSSLGLWMGLSALGVYDFVVVYFDKIKKLICFVTMPSRA